MLNDSNWAEEVRRWFEAGKPLLASGAPLHEEGDGIDLGYEAAYPPLQARHWPDAPDGAKEHQ